jgi:hypothetical protein
MDLSIRFLDVFGPHMLFRKAVSPIVKPKVRREIEAQRRKLPDPVSHREKLV